MIYSELAGWGGGVKIFNDGITTRRHNDGGVSHTLFEATPLPTERVTVSLRPHKAVSSGRHSRIKVSLGKETVIAVLASRVYHRMVTVCDVGGHGVVTMAGGIVLPTVHGVP